nr:MAG TPA: hypothetical protein [Caudoviricetes sp.]
MNMKFDFYLGSTALWLLLVSLIKQVIGKKNNQNAPS